MSDPFARHGIDHLSVSSLALYRNEPARWVAQYLYGIKDRGGAAAWRGTAVEAGLNQALAGEDNDTSAAAALANFALNERDAQNAAQGGALDEDTQAAIDRERANIEPMVRQVADNLRALGRPLTTQRRVERRLPGIEVPIIGYVDYEWDEYIVDLKTTLRLPSAPRPDHAVQVVHYADTLSKRPGLIYVTAKKIQRFAMEHIDVDEARWTLRRSALALRIMLEVAADREEAVNFHVPKFDDFRWSGPAKEAARQIWR